MPVYVGPMILYAIRTRLWLGCALVVLMLASPLSSVRAAPDAELWGRWVGHDPASTETVDHAPWDRFLAQYRIVQADGIAHVRYGAVSDADRVALATYLGTLAATRVTTLNRGQQRAFWINLYNALTVQLVLERYPVGSIRDIDISPGVFSDGPWGAKLITVEGEPLSLDDIEHRILRPIWQDPRLHYVVNCASLSCPDLPPRAFTAENAEAMLDAAARAYVNHPRALTIDDGDLIVSSIYDWYADDFGASDAAIIGHLRAYAMPDLAARLDTFTAIDDDRYDWRLNDAP